jgi:NAD(P) transhydrogenase subunit beta
MMAFFLAINYSFFGALAIGTIAGFFAAKKVKMTAMPEMVSLLMEWRSMRNADFNYPNSTMLLDTVIFLEHLSEKFWYLASQSAEVKFGNRFRIDYWSCFFCSSIMSNRKLSGKLKMEFLSNKGLSILLYCHCCLLLQ